MYGNLLYHFGRGMAFAQSFQVIGSETRTGAMKELMKDSILLLPLSPFSAAIEGAIVAESLLEGTIALKEKKYNDAITHSKSGETEENMVYNEPRDWILNPKHYLGNAYLQAKKFPAARRFFRMTCNIITKYVGRFRVIPSFAGRKEKSGGAKNIKPL